MGIMSRRRQADEARRRNQTQEVKAKKTFVENAESELESVKKVKKNGSNSARKS